MFFFRWFLNEENNKAISGTIIVIDTSLDRSIVVSVSLLNIIRYMVCLVPNYNGIPIKTRYGHLFDPHGHKIHELGKSSLVLAKALPPSIQIVKSSIWLPG